MVITQDGRGRDDEADERQVRAEEVQRAAGPSQDERDDGHDRAADREQREDQREPLLDDRRARTPAGRLSRRLSATSSTPHRRPHLSIPPMTGSSEATIAIVSAIRLPGSSAGTVCRLRKLGSWIRKRNGWSEPSLIA